MLQVYVLRYRGREYRAWLENQENTTAPDRPTDELATVNEIASTAVAAIEDTVATASSIAATAASTDISRRKRKKKYRAAYRTNEELKRIK